MPDTDKPTDEEMYAVMARFQELVADGAIEERWVIGEDGRAEAQYRLREDDEG